MTVQHVPVSLNLTDDPTAPLDLSLDGEHLTIEHVVRLARGDAPGPAPRIDPSARAGMQASVDAKHEMVALGAPVYGITTGFGDSVARHISTAKTRQLQRNLITYHLNGIGPVTAPDVTRATTLIRANCLVRGPSAIRPEVVELLLELLARDVRPPIPERGSLGASGDLVPLCYLANALLGDGEVHWRGRVVPASTALVGEGLAPVTLEMKEGLALVNGTSFTSAFAVLGWWDAAELAVAADIATAMACEGLQGNVSHFDDFVHAHKPHPGQRASATLLRELLDGSALTTDYERLVEAAEDLDGRHFVQQDHRVQDPYSLRCAPHVVGVLRDTLDWSRSWLEVEINASTDNPLVDAEEGRLHHGGNFYAGHVGAAADALKVATASVADLLDRQLQLLVDEKFNRGLTANLIAPRSADDPEAGLHHGFKGVQIAASALTAEALQSTMPATSFSRSSEAHNQDKVSMGTIAARGLRTVVELTRAVAAIHLIAAAQAVDLRGAHLASPVTSRVHALLREHVPFVDEDRRLDGDVETVARLIADGSVRRAAGVGGLEDLVQRQAGR